MYVLERVKPFCRCLLLQVKCCGMTCEFHNSLLCTSGHYASSRLERKTKEYFHLTKKHHMRAWGESTCRGCLLGNYKLLLERVAVLAQLFLLRSSQKGWTFLMDYFNPWRFMNEQAKLLVKCKWDAQSWPLQFILAHCCGKASKGHHYNASLWAREESFNQEVTDCRRGCHQVGLWWYLFNFDFTFT